MKLTVRLQYVTASSFTTPKINLGLTWKLQIDMTHSGPLSIKSQLLIIIILNLFSFHNIFYITDVHEILKYISPILFSQFDFSVCV